MVGFDYVKTRTLAYVQSYDWLPIIVQFSKICAPSYGVLEYNNISIYSCQQNLDKFYYKFQKIFTIIFAHFHSLILQIRNLSYITLLDISYKENLKQKEAATRIHIAFCCGFLSIWQCVNRIPYLCLNTVYKNFYI